MNKWIGISLGSLIGISHISMIGLLASRTNFPALPVGEYTSYTVESGKDGYRINYRANDPLVMGLERTSKDLVAFWGWVKLNLISKSSTRWRGLDTYIVQTHPQRLVPPKPSVLRRQEEENKHE